MEVPPRNKAINPARVSVLVVDDEAAVLAGVDAILADEADVVTCESPREALRLVDQRPFDVVCADFRMPEMNGVVLLQEVARRRPHAGRLLLTGADEYFKRQDNADYYLMLKPYDPIRLIAMVQQLARIAKMKSSVAALSPSSRPAAPPSSGRGGRGT